MSICDGLVIVAKILELVAEGISKSQAVSKTASMFDIDEDDIWRHEKF